MLSCFIQPRYNRPSCSRAVGLHDRLAMPSTSTTEASRSRCMHDDDVQVKEELKLAIQTRRVNQGLNALPLPIKQETKKQYEV